MAEAKWARVEDSWKRAAQRDERAATLRFLRRNRDLYGKLAASHRSYEGHVGSSLQGACMWGRELLDNIARMIAREDHLGGEDEGAD